MSEPTLNGHRDKAGKFLAGNPGGPGNPYTADLQRLRALLPGVFKPDNMLAILTKLRDAAEEGQPWAIKEVLDRLFGKPEQALVSPDGSVTTVILRLEDARAPLDVVAETAGIPRLPSA